MEREIMCLAIPSKVIRVDKDIATIDVSGVRREASIVLIDDVHIGDYVIVHAGYAIQKIDEDAAMETLKVLGEVFAPTNE
ncbi:HypC/HybG/HupF family hydrogenase formation chaperone [Thermodesulfobacteriota bacterium]